MNLKVVLVLGACILAFNANAQKVKLVSGKVPSDFSSQSSVNLEFTFKNVKVGKFDREADYVQSKKEDYNKKEAGSGDNWAAKWESDKQERFKPKFEELYTKYADQTLSGNAKYTIIFNTSFIEPGFNVGVTRKNAVINGEATIVETANKSKVLAVLNVTKAPGKSFWGTDFDTGGRLSETYATAGRGVAKFVKK